MLILDSSIIISSILGHPELITIINNEIEQNNIAINSITKNEIGRTIFRDFVEINNLLIANIKDTINLNQFNTFWEEITFKMTLIRSSQKVKRMLNIIKIIIKKFNENLITFLSEDEGNILKSSIIHTINYLGWKLENLKRKINSWKLITDFPCSYSDWDLNFIIEEDRKYRELVFSCKEKCVEKHQILEEFIKNDLGLLTKIKKEYKTITEENRSLELDENFLKILQKLLKNWNKKESKFTKKINYKTNECLYLADLLVCMSGNSTDIIFTYNLKHFGQFAAILNRNLRYIEYDATKLPQFQLQDL